MKKKRVFAFLLTLIMIIGCCGCSASAKGLVTTSPKKAAELAQKGEPFWAEHTQHPIGETVTVTEYIRPLSYVLQYPETGYPETDTRIKAIVDEIRNAFEQEFLPEASAEGETKRVQKTEATLYLAYDAYLTDETNLSLLLFETHETKDGMSPHTRIQAFHFDLSKDQEIPAEKMMWNGFTKNASAYTQKYFSTTEPYSKRIFGDYARRLAPENGMFDRFAFTEEGVLFHFDRYSLFPGSMGIVTLTIPYETMRAKLPTPAEKPEDAKTEITDRKMVVLTFDDGPNPVHTNAILDILEKYDARATFFDLGYLVEKYPDVVKREAALGCEVASHSYGHDNFNKLSAAQITADVQRMEAIFQKVLGKSPASFRPPYGNCNESVKSLIPLPIYLWSVDTLDWKSRNANSIVNEVKKCSDLDGKVILMHSIYSSTAEATAILVPYLQEQGYELVTVSELVAAKHGETPENSKIYGYHYFQ